jgi:exonuclease SbcD
MTASFGGNLRISGRKESAMPFESLQFVHAANLYLDRQLEGTGLFPDSLRETIEDATIWAFERVISTCIDSEVDFLLLTGNSFDETEKSLRARVALRDGFARLAEENIRVFVTPGKIDPPEAWRAVPHLPDNVTLLLHRSEEPVAVIRNERVIATITRLQTDSTEDNGRTTDHSLQQNPHAAGTRKTPFAIGITVPESEATHLKFSQFESGYLEAGRDSEQDDRRETNVSDQILSLLKDHSIDYLAIGHGSLRKTIVREYGVVHHPGRTQGLNPEHAGPQGCSLVNVDVNSGIQTTFIDTARVCWEPLPIEIDPKTDREQLLERMMELLNDFQREATQKILVVQWLIRGFGRLFDTLYDEEFRKQLTNELSENCSLTSCFHRTRVIQPKSAGKPETAIQSLNSNSLLNEFLESVTDTQHVSPELLDALFDATHIQKENRSNRFDSFRTRCDIHSVREHVEHLGELWLTEDSDGEHLP